LIQFQHIEYLIGLIAIPFLAALYYYTLRWKKKVSKKIGDEALVKALTKNFSPLKYSFKFILVLLAFSFAVIGLSGLRSPSGTTGVKRNGIDVMIALDVSKSMLAQDIQPNRLERAKQLIAKLVDQLPNDRIGIVVFAGRAYLQMPITNDHVAAKMFLSSASPDMIPTQGTVIGDALKMCYAAFNSKEKKYKSILLISDGEDHDEEATNIAKELAADGIMINTVGIGSLQGATIPDATTGELKKDADGNAVITRLNETTLQGIAAAGNGLYQQFTTADEVSSQINNQLKSIDRKAVNEVSSTIYQQYYQWFIAAAILLLLLEFFISEKANHLATKKPPFKQKIGSNKWNATLISLMIFLAVVGNAFVVPLMAQSENALIKKGNDAYIKSDFYAATLQYNKALELNKASNMAMFNLGNALYKNGKTSEADQAFDEAIANSKTAIDKSRAWYNKGVVLQNSKKLAESIDAYKNALRQNAADEDARFNLQKALLEKKQQEQKEESKKQDQKKNKDQQKDQQQKQNENKEAPKPQPSKMTKKEAEEKLKALLQQEKNLQDKLRRTGEASPNKPEKDW